MAKIWGYSEGDRSELFGRFLLSALGHTTIVERQDDHFGVDLYLKFVESVDRKKIAQLTGFECAFQIKSNTESIKIDTDDKWTGLFELHQPLFICVVDRRLKNMNIYSTLGRFAAYLANGGPLTEIVFDLKKPDFFPESGPSRSPFEVFENVWCEKPIVSVKYDALDGKNGATVRKNIRKVMEFWIAVERKAIWWQQYNIALAPYVENYKTNKIPDAKVSVFNFTTESNFATISGHTMDMLDQARITLEMANIPIANQNKANKVAKMLLSTRLDLEKSSQEIFGKPLRSYKNIEYVLSDPTRDALKL